MSNPRNGPASEGGEQMSEGGEQMRAAAGTIWGVLIDLRLINGSLGPGNDTGKLAGKLDILSAELADAARMIRAAHQVPGGNAGTEGRSGDDG